MQFIIFFLFLLIFFEFLFGFLTSLVFKFSRLTILFFMIWICTSIYAFKLIIFMDVSFWEYLPASFFFFDGVPVHPNRNIFAFFIDWV